MVKTSEAKRRGINKNITDIHFLCVFLFSIFFMSTLATADEQDIEEELQFEDDDLLNLSVEDLMDVEVVTASKKSEQIWDAPGVISVVTKEEIRMFGARNLFDILNRMPSIYGIGSYMFPQNAVSVRGDMLSHVSNHILILINGRPVRESLLGGLNYSVLTGFPIEMIERIELVRGPGSVLYGTSAYTGVINIITKKGDEPGIGIAMEGGSHGYYKSSLFGGANGEDFKFYSAGNWSNRDGWNFSAIDEKGIDNSIDWGQDSGSVAAYLEYGGFSFNLFWARQKVDHFGKAPIWSLPGHTLMTDRLFTDLGHTIDINDDWRISSHLGLNYNNILYESRNAERESKDYLGEITLLGKLSDDLNLLAGIVGERQSGPDLIRSSIPKYTRRPLGAYAQLDYKPIERLKVFGGTQLIRPQKGDSDMITRVGAIFEFTPNLGMKLLRGEAFRAPYAIET